MPVVDTYTRSPAGREGGSELISERRVSLSNSMLNSNFLGQTPSNLRDVDNGDRNAARMVQQVVPTLQPGYPYRGNAASGSHGDWNPQAGYQPPPAVPLRNVQDQHRYVHGSGHGNYHYLLCRRVPSLIVPNKLKSNLLPETRRDPQDFLAPPTMCVNYRIVVDPASSTPAFKNNWIIAKRTWRMFSVFSSMQLYHF